jgi:hypothetical protein
MYLGLPGLASIFLRNWLMKTVFWSPDTKLVVRAGLGVFYNQDIGNGISTWRATSPAE